MATPMIKEEIKKTEIKQESYAKANGVQARKVRPSVKMILERRLKEHSKTWQELAKR